MTQKRKEWARRNPEKAREIERRKYERKKAKRPPKPLKPPRPPALTAAERKKRHLERNPLKAACYKIYKYAIKHEKLLRGPCHVCGATEGIDGHHTDYTKPLEVLWLCKVHHREMHKQQISD